MYVFGSVRKGTAGTGDDLDLLVHFRGDPAKRDRLEAWLDGWSACLSELNFLRTGVRRERLIDVNIVTDEEVAGRVGYASKISEGKALRLEVGTRG
jgi:predicted nucleotidyltransferase